MGRSFVGNVLRLSRVEACLLSFATVFLPYFLHTRDWSQSAAVSSPTLTIAMCTFILNDINDVERDRVNHPNRALPSGAVTARAAVVIYFLAFGASLLLVKLSIKTDAHFLYLLFFLMAINYNIVVNDLPRLKNLYVASVATLPILIVNNLAGERIVPVGLMVPVFLFTFGREMLMDVRDLRGDGLTLAKSLPAGVAGAAGFALQGASILSLALFANNLLKISSLALAVVIFATSLILWRKPALRANILRFLALNMLAFLVFLT